MPPNSPIVRTGALSPIGVRGSETCLTGGPAQLGRAVSLRDPDGHIADAPPETVVANLRRVGRIYFTVTVKQLLCRMEPSLPSRRHCTSKRTPSTKGAPREISKCSAPAPPVDVVSVCSFGGGS